MQGLAIAGIQNRTGYRRVLEGTRRRGRGVQLNSAQRRAVDDIGRVVPRNRARRRWARGSAASSAASALGGSAATAGHDVDEHVSGSRVVVTDILRREVH